jgi:hypothetical protein
MSHLKEAKQKGKKKEGEKGRSEDFFYCKRRWSWEGGGGKKYEKGTRRE